jgi:flagellar biosynthesis/type III secretory pathway chaperone
MNGMELDNQTARHAYIQLLVDTLKKKSEILNQLMQLTIQQESLIASDHFSDEKFLEIVSLKDEQIAMLKKMDDGFEKLYESVKEEIQSEKEKYKDKISSLKELIVTVTDTSVKLQAIEKRNKARMDVYFSNRRMEIKKSRLSNRTVANYYKTISKQHESQSYFYDKKN